MGFGSAEDSYIIRAQVLVEDKAGPGAKGVTNKLDAVERKAKKVGLSITRILGGAFAAIGGIAVVGRMTQGIIGLNAEIQEASFGMASLLSATTGIEIADALGIARREVGLLRRDAASGVGELSDYLQGFQMLLAPVLQAGGDTETVRSLTRNAIAAGFALRGVEGMRLAPMDIQQALTAGLGQRTTPIALAAVRAAGMTQEAFNKLDVTEKIEALNEAFQKFAPGVELMGTTWAAQMSTMNDAIKGIIRTVTGPLFDRWSTQLRGVNDWLERNAESITKIAEDIAPKLVAVWDVVIDKIRLAIVLAGSLVVAQAGVSAGGAIAGITSFGAAFVALGTALAPLLVITAAVTFSVMALLAAWEEYPDTLDRVKDSAGAVLSTFESLLGVLDGLGGEGGGALAIIGVTFSDLIVVPMLESLAGLIIGVSLFIRVFQLGAELLIAQATALFGVLFPLQSLEQTAQGYESDMEFAFRKFWADLAKLTKPPGARQAEADDPSVFVGPQLPDAGLPVVKNVTNIGTVEVTVKAEVNADPARVAIAFEEVLDSLQRNPRQSRRDPFGDTELG